MFLKFLCFIFCFITISNAGFDFAEEQFIQDDEIESFLEEILGELFKTAGVSLKPKVLICCTSDVNAGATYGGYILVTTSFLIKCENAKELVGVLAHETGHIKGAHLHKSNAGSASLPALATIAIGGAASILTGNPAPIMASIYGGAQVFERGILKHSREQEESADASAIKLLREKGWPSEGLASFLLTLEKLYGNSELKNAYTMTHPLSRDRRQKIESNGTTGSLPKHYEDKFQRIRAKMFGFMMYKNVKIIYKTNNFYSSYANAIAYFQNGDSKKALSTLDDLLKVGEDPYILELKGQFLFDIGNIKESVVFLKRALKASSKSHNMGISMQLAHALTEEGKDLSEAIKILNVLLDKNSENIVILKLLANAYGKKGDEPCASVFLAKIAMLEGNVIECKRRLEGSASKCSNRILKKQVEDMLDNLKQLPIKNVT